jgi:hypothetical protein
LPAPWRRQRCSHFQTAARGHLNVQKHQIRAQFQYLLNGLFTILGFANDVDIVN